MLNETLVNMTPEVYNYSGFGEGLFTGIFLVLFFIFLIFLIVGYVYRSIVWMRIARNSKHKRPWLAWIPFANGAMILQLGGFHWALIFLWLIPILGWIALMVLFIISNWRIFESFGYNGALSLIKLVDIIISGVGSIGILIVLGFVAWKPKKKFKSLKKKN